MEMTLGRRKKTTTTTTKTKMISLTMEEKQMIDLENHLKEKEMKLSFYLRKLIVNDLKKEKSNF